MTELLIATWDVRTAYNHIPSSCKYVYKRSRKIGKGSRKVSVEMPKYITITS